MGDEFLQLKMLPWHGFNVEIQTREEKYGEMLSLVCEKVARLFAVYFTRAGREAIVSAAGGSACDIDFWGRDVGVDLNHEQIERFTRVFRELTYNSMIKGTPVYINYKAVQSNFLGKAIRESGLAQERDIWRCFEFDYMRDLEIFNGVMARPYMSIELEVSVGRVFQK